MGNTEQSLWKRFGKTLELPEDVLSQDAVITLSGRTSLRIENYKGILEYTPVKIRLALLRGQLEVTGKALTILYYTSIEIKITGRIEKIEFRM